jgi:phosphopantetheine--protein transferase-like protein
MGPSAAQFLRTIRPAGISTITVPASYKVRSMLGIDLVFIPEFRERVADSGGKIVEVAFRSSEIQSPQPEHLAGLWAAKEAVVDAATPSKWTDIVITHDGSRIPRARLGGKEFAISVAHRGDYAVAVAHRPGP